MSFFNTRRYIAFIFIVLSMLYLILKIYNKDTLINKTEKPYVNVYDWYGMLPKDILDQFESETGIKLRYDMFDNNEVLEAKLLASNSGYDVVFPSASPYVARQIAMGAYQPLKKELLPNYKNLDSFIVDKMESIDSNLHYTIPYYWGTLGIAYDTDKINILLPNVPKDSYELLFNLENIKKLAPYGVSFLEEAVDVFPLLLIYLNYDPSSIDSNHSQHVQNHLLQLRPYIRRFTSSRFINDLVMGDVCIAQAWSGEAQQAEKIASDLGRSIKYIIPKEGTTLWIDCIAIPVGAPHPKNAHKLINFLLRPDISARITNHTMIPTIVKDAFPLVDLQLQQDKNIYPPAEIKGKLHLNKVYLDKEGMNFERERTKNWAKIRLMN